MQLSHNLIILYPTDTLYGLGVDATDAEMILRLRELKGRDEGKPFSVAVDSVGMLEHYAEVTPLARRLAERFLPGKLTLVLQAKCSMSRHRTLTAGVVAPDGSVGIRIPDHPQALAFVRGFGKPITATSANVSGMPAERTVEKILEQFGERSIMIYHTIDIPPELPPSEPSTVVDARGNEPIILREGAISAETIRRAMV